LKTLHQHEKIKEKAKCQGKGMWLAEKSHCLLLPKPFNAWKKHASCLKVSTSASEGDYVPSSVSPREPTAAAQHMPGDPQAHAGPCEVSVSPEAEESTGKAQTTRSKRLQAQHAIPASSQSA